MNSSQTDTPRLTYHTHTPYNSCIYEYIYIYTIRLYKQIYIQKCKTKITTQSTQDT